MKRDSTQRIRRAAIRLAAAVLLSLVVYGLLQIPARQPGYAAADGTVARQYRIDHNEDYLSAFRAGLSRQRRTGESPP